MIQVPTVTLHKNARQQLRAWTREIQAIPTFDVQVSTAKRRWKSRNRKGNKTYDRVKIALTAMCPGVRRCVYCEDSYADEVEHIHPKDIYPTLCFAWENYVYACGPCNGPKSNRFAVFDATGVEHDVTPPRPPKPPAVPPPRTPPVAGSPLLINPRHEDPLVFLFLDLETGVFVPHPGLSPQDKRRAEYTREVLGMNSRRLPKARRDAFGNYSARLREYAAKKTEGASAPELDALRDELLALDHPTVWREMQRQHPTIPGLAPLFTTAPEAAGW